MQHLTQSASELLAKALAADAERSADERRWQRAATTSHRAEADRRRQRRLANRRLARRRTR